MVVELQTIDRQTTTLSITWNNPYIVSVHACSSLFNDGFLYVMHWNQLSNVLRMKMPQVQLTWRFDSRI